MTSSLITNGEALPRLGERAKFNRAVMRNRKAASNTGHTPNIVVWVTTAFKNVSLVAVIRKAFSKTVGL